MLLAVVIRVHARRLGIKGFLIHAVFCSLASDRDVLDAGRPRVDTVCASCSGRP
jgi:hypothetical protein